jgi:hypothetical protein
VFQGRYSFCHSAKAEYSSPPNREARVPSLAISLNPRSRSKARKAEKPSGYGTHGLGGLPSYSTTSNRPDRVRSLAMKAPWCLMKCRKLAISTPSSAGKERSLFPSSTTSLRMVTSLYRLGICDNDVSSLSMAWMTLPGGSNVARASVNVPAPQPRSHHLCARAPAIGLSESIRSRQQCTSQFGSVSLVPSGVKLLASMASLRNNTSRPALFQRS